MTAPELRLVDAEPAEPAPDSPASCLCGSAVEVVVTLRNRSIGLCKPCYFDRISDLKRGSGRGA